MDKAGKEVELGEGASWDKDKARYDTTISSLGYPLLAEISAFQALEYV